MEQAAGFEKILAEGASQLGLSLTTDHLAQFARHLRELQHWNAKINLTAITDEREIAVKHFLDSLICSRALVEAPRGPLLDIGSGAGFPGLPLKVYLPRLSVTLLEPNQKKTAFLRHVVGTLQLTDVSVVSTRIEDLAKWLDYSHHFVHIVSRALDATQVASSITPLLASAGQLILYRSKPLDSQPLSGLTLVKEITYELPFGHGKRVLSLLQPGH